MNEMTSQTKELFVSDLKVKDSVDSLFLIKYLALMEGRDGRHYLNIVASDSTGEVECRLWTKAQETYEEIKKGNFARIKGKVNLYQGRKQLIIQEIDLVSPDEVNEKDFVVKSHLSADDMFSRLMEIVDQLDDFYLSELLKVILAEPEIKRRLLLWPAGKTIHHAYQSGLLEHILSCSELAMSLSRHFKVNHNYVITGAILHDLGKIYELTEGLVADYSEEGKLVGHMAKILEIIDRYTYRVKDFPYSTKMHLKHIILAHHGEYEYGSPKIPQTSEAMLVHLIDYLDSKMNAFEMIKKNDTNPGNWSSFVKHLDRIVYKSDLPFFPFPSSENQESPEHQEGLEATHAPLEDQHKYQQRSNRPHQNNRDKNNRGPLKQNLGKFLQGFKVEG